MNGGQSFGLRILLDTNSKVPRMKYVYISPESSIFWSDVLFWLLVC